MKSKNCIILTIFAYFLLVGCTLTAKKQIEKELILGKPVNDYVLETTEKQDIIVENRHDRVYKDLPTEESPIIIIEEKQFLTKIANIKNKIEQYQDKIIVVEGMYATYSSWDDSFTASLVYRNGPNDFNNDIWGGFFLSDLQEKELKIDDWIRVSGKPYISKVKDSEGTEYEYLYLEVFEIQILTEKDRGAELVNN